MGIDYHTNQIDNLNDCNQYDEEIKQNIDETKLEMILSIKLIAYKLS